MTPIEKAINFALLQMEDIPDLKQLEGKMIQVHLLPVEVSFFIKLMNREIKITHTSEEPAVTKITGYPSTFLKFLVSKSKTIPADIQVEGDLNSLTHLNRVLQEFDLDWEELLSKFIGDPATHVVSHGIKRFTNWFKDRSEATKSNLSEFAIDEVQIVPAKIELETFYKEVDELRDQTERLAMKIERLNHAH